MARGIHSAEGQRGDIAVDTMRAMACIALVSFHVVGNTPAAGMELPADHWLSVLNRSLVDMRMPLFSFLSGMVFVTLERTRRGPQALLGSKARRLLIPMLSVGALFWLTRDLMGQAQQPLGTIAFLPFAHFWFLQATFVIMAVFVALTWVSGRRDIWVAGLLMGLGAALWIIGAAPFGGVFSAHKALHLMPFFMAGYLCRRLGAPRMDLRLALAVLMALVAVGAGLALGVLELSLPLRRGLGVACGLVFCLTLLALRPQSRVLARLGAMSYAIFLFHVFFTAGMREAWLVLWPAVPEAVMWLSGVAAGILGPVLLYRAITRNMLLSFVFLGLKLTPVARPVATRPLSPEAVGRI
ncbi:MAG: acyltransferase [Pseudomonadota bacterium]